MTNEYILYQKFTDLESAEDFVKELKDNGIDYLLQDNNHAYVKVVGYNSVDIAIGVNLKAKDFVRADEILEKYYDDQIKTIDRSYYLFDFTEEELKEIIFEPFEWGRLDYQLAKHILKERGTRINDSEIDSIKTQRINELRKEEKAGSLKIISGYLFAIVFPLLAVYLNTFIGYILSFVFPLGALFISLTIKYNRKILPNGEIFYINTNQDRKHGHWIFLISATCVCLFFLLFLYEI